MKRALLALGLALSTVLSAIAIVSLAGGEAQPVGRPHWCHEGWSTSACAVIFNQTQGFAPGGTSASTSNGFNLNFTGFVEGNCASCQNYVNVSPILPEAWGGANIASTGGLQSGSIGTIHYAGPSSVFGGTGGPINIWLEVPHSGNNVADCRTYQSEYLRCTEQWPAAPSGPKNDPWWYWTVKDRPYVLIVRNYVTGDLQLLRFTPTNALSATVPGTHTLPNIGAATVEYDNLGGVAGSRPAEGFDTGLLTMKDNGVATFNLEYRFTSGPHVGSTLTINVIVPMNGTSVTDEGQAGTKTADSYCNVGASATAGSLNCSVDRFTAHPFDQNTLVVTIGK